MVNTAINLFKQRNNCIESYHIKAALFDMDGVLYNSMPLHAEAWTKAMKKHNIDFPKELAYKYEGMRGSDIVKLMVKLCLNSDIQEDEARKIYEDKAAIFHSYPQPEITDGVKEVMQQMKNEGIKICVVTGSGQRVLLNRMANDFQEFISPDSIICAFDVTNGKPHPEPYLKGMQKLGIIDAKEVVVVENAPLGVKSGNASGAFTIGVNTGNLPKEELLSNGADIVFNTMQELNKQWINISTTFNN